jgi:hypothetical protein
VIRLSNDFLEASFSMETGNLMTLRADSASPNLLTGTWCWHSDPSGRRTEQKDFEGASRFEVLRVTKDASSIESVIRSPQVEIQRRWELSPDQPLLKARFRVRAATRSVRLEEPAFPHVEFAPDLADPFEDERDLYDDGVELGDGWELPPWRVFFWKGQDRGLMLVTRSKGEMSHVRIGTRGFDFLPHVPVAYDTVLALKRLPMEFSRKRSYEIQFELGPWSRGSHRRIFRAAHLEQPLRVAQPPARGRPQRLKRGKVFFAVKFAPPAKASKTFDRNRWLIARVPWAQKGQALVAGTGVKTPPLTLNPKLRGDYRLFVGIGNGDGVVVRVSGAPEPIVRMNPGLHDTPFHLRLSGRHKSQEVDCGVFRTDGKTLRLERFSNRHTVSMIDYVRFEKLDPAAVRRREQRLRTPPRVPLSGFVDVPDIADLTDTENPTLRLYTANIWEHTRCGFKRIYWRIDGQCSDYPSKVNTMRYVSAKVHSVFLPQAKSYGRALKRFDMLRAAVAAARKHGVELYGWMRFNWDHPAYWEHHEHGRPGRKLCIAIEAVRRHKIAILVEAAKYGLDGLNLGFLRHPPVLHYHPVLVDGFRAKYGVPPPRAATNDGDLTHLKSLPESTPEYLRWYQYRAEYLTQFGRELGQALRDAGLADLRIAIWTRPNHALFDGIDVGAWVNEGLCDEVVADVAGPEQLGMPFAEPTESWKAMVRQKAKLSRGISYHNYPWSRDNFRRLADEGYDGICTYESNFAVLDNRFIGLYELLRR